MKHHLRLASQQLEAAREKWLKEEQVSLAQAEAVRQMTDAKIGKLTYMREELKRRRQRAALAAEAVHQGGRKLADPAVLEHKKDKGEVEAYNNAMIEEVVQEIETLGLAEEKEKDDKEKEKEKEDGEGGGSA